MNASPPSTQDYAKPITLDDALVLRSRNPRATVIAGGTDVMVAVNEGRRRLEEAIDVSDVAELRAWELDGDHVRIGAALPLTRVVDELAEHLPGLAAAARLVGSPAIRHRATLGGNIATASPAGDTLLPILAGGAVIELASIRGVRHVRSDEFFLGPGRSVLAEDELVVAVRAPLRRSEAFAKTGTRRAMVISVVAAAVSFDVVGHRLGIALGSVAPTPRRATSAEQFATAELDWSGRTQPDHAWWSELGEHAATDVAPIDDLRSTAEHRLRAAAVLVTRTVRQAWRQHCHRIEGSPC